MTNYTKEYFINKFSAIHDENWHCGGELQDEENPTDGIGCALYHCGVREDAKRTHYIPTEESLALAKLLNKGKKIHEDDSFEIVYRINDGGKFKNQTPKEAIIEALENC